MRIKGLAYALRDAREEWGDFRIPTIEALIHIGKVTRSCEVRREGTSNWQPIMHVPELAQLFDGAGGELPGGKGTAGRKTGEGPAIGAGARRAIRPPQDQLAPTAAALAASAAEASEPYLEAVEQESYPSTEATTYKVICADGTMLGPLPLPMLLAQIWDRRVGSADLVSRDAGSWVSAVQLPELARALEKVEPGGEAQGRTVTPSPSGSPLPNSSRSLSALPISGAGLAAPEPAGASFVTEVVRS
ncbi:MAG: hypothetical protein FJ125_17500, partial [Deltaproteobacteria bacterium]|nr:hypothetical protein [Deltaproteobacteria bacterium]